MPASSANRQVVSARSDRDRPAVRLRSVTVDHGLGTHGEGIRALDGIDLTVQVGERVGLLGPSGAGKSTLLDAVAGLVAPTAGTVEVLGSPLPDLTGRALRRHRADIGVVRQHHGLPASMRVVHNVNGGRLGSWSTWRAMTSLIRPRGRADVDDVLAQLGLEGLADRPTGDLSGGQQQRVAVARALIVPRRLLLADEPVSAVDPKLSDDVLARICSAGDDTTVLVSVHDPGLARRHLDRVIGLRDGRLVFDLPAVDATDRHLDDLYRSVPSTA